MKHLSLSAPLTAVLLAATSLPALAQMTLPSNADNTCGIDQTTFDSWFKSGSASAGGAVGPADSLTFPPLQNTKCDFYQWGQQMFLWLTSPAGDGPVLDGTNFYNVVETGSGFEFQPSGGDGVTLVGVRTIKSEDIGGAGQAGGSDALISLGNSATYFGIHTNDIYAQYLTAQMGGAFAGTPLDTNFPISAAEVQQIENTVGMTFTDAEAMTMELKSAWVDAGTLAAQGLSPNDFVIMNAVVPDFDQSDPTSWPSNGNTKTVRLAMVGLHIVAPVQGHPEMVWASFEHISNSAEATYFYTETGGTTTGSVAYDSAGIWLYLNSGAAEPSALNSAATYDGSAVAINSIDGTTPIAAIDVVQKNPWGNAPSNDADIVASNTDLVSLNASVLGMLSGLGDVRSNYYQLGGIWSQKGQLPTGDSDSFLRGGLQLANSTMETFHQFPVSGGGFNPKSCFGCHNTTGTSGLDLSHIYNSLSPLK